MRLSMPLMSSTRPLMCSLLTVRHPAAKGLSTVGSPLSALGTFSRSAKPLSTARPLSTALTADAKWESSFLEATAGMRSDVRRASLPSYAPHRCSCGIAVPWPLRR